MSLSPEQRREYRAIAHNLKPVIIVGDKGLSEGLQEELERALNDHELIKIKVASQDREARQEAITALCESSGASWSRPSERSRLFCVGPSSPTPSFPTCCATSTDLTPGEAGIKKPAGETRAGFLLPADRIRRIRPARSRIPRYRKAREWQPHHLRSCPPAPGQWERRSTVCLP